jgi:hypothetical protein
MNQWTVTVDKIEKRVDRYERKAILKAKYGKRGEETVSLDQVLTNSNMNEEPEDASFETVVSVPPLRFNSPLSINYPSSLPAQRTLFSPWSMSRGHSTIDEEDGDSSDDEEETRSRRRMSEDEEITRDTEREPLLLRK